MKFSEVDKISSSNTELIRDCYFDNLSLLGKIRKNFDTNEKTISYIENEKYIDDFFECDIKGGVICTKEVSMRLKNKYNGGILVSSEPKTTFFEIHNYLNEKLLEYDKTYISKTAKIDKSVKIPETGVYIGDDVVIYSNVVIKEGTFIGNGTIIRENSVIGSPAFYYYENNNGRTLVKSTGTVKIGNNVELHANVVVEKGVMYGETLIDDNTKIDNGVVIGHDVEIGKNCTIAGNSDIAGWVYIGDGTFLGVLSAVAPSVSIGRNAKLSSGAVVTKDVNEGEHVSGNFAIIHEKYINHIKNISK